MIGNGYAHITGVLAERGMAPVPMTGRFNTGQSMINVGSV